jgi:hypothetical protein
MKFYIVYEIEENYNWSNDSNDKDFTDIFFVSSLEKAKEFLQRAIAEKYYGLTPTTKIMVSESFIDKYDDKFNVLFEGKISKFLKKDII